MFFRCSIALAVVAWASALGWHWPVIQVATWIKMAAQYQSAIGWGPALQVAVTGPKCHLCHAIEKGRADARKREEPTGGGEHEVRLLLAPPGKGLQVVAPPRVPMARAGETATSPRERERPPVPPPRTTAV